MELNIREALDKFLQARKERFPFVSHPKFEDWVSSIEAYFEEEICGSDLFYDCKPDDVVEADENE